MKKQEHLLNKLSSLCIKYDWKKEFATTTDNKLIINSYNSLADKLIGKVYIDLSLNDDNVPLKSPTIQNNKESIATPKSKNVKNIGPSDFKSSKKLAIRTKELFDKFNSIVFENKLPNDMDISWNKRLLTTGGITKLKYIDGNKVALIELSQKVLYGKISFT